MTSLDPTRIQIREYLTSGYFAIKLLDQKFRGPQIDFRINSEKFYYILSAFEIDPEKFFLRCLTPKFNADDIVCRQVMMTILITPL